MHEAAHQLACNSEHQTRGVMYPVWISIGLATHFETDAGFSGDNPARRHRLASAYREGHLYPLVDFLVMDRMPEGEETSMDMYAQTWGFVRFLYERNNKAFRRDLYTLSQRPAGHRPIAALRKEFIISIDAMDRVQDSWVHFLDSLVNVEIKKAEGPS